MKKRLLSLLLAASMMINCLPMSAWAMELPKEELQRNSMASDEDVDIITSGDCGASATWTLDANGTLTISGTGEMRRYHSEETHEGFNWIYKAPWSDNKSDILKVIIEEGVTSISEYAFYNCNRLQDIDIADTVSTIGKNAFTGCRSLTKLDIPESVSDFSKSYDLVSLKEINVSENNPYLCSENGVLYNKEKTKLMFCLETYLQTTFTVPKSVTYIYDGAFRNCSNLVSIEIQGNITRIDDDTFRNCSNLISVEIPDSVISIGDSAFRSCESLKNIALPNGLVSMEGAVFFGCESLESIVIPETMTSIAVSAFEDCYSLRKVVLPEGLLNIGRYAFMNCKSLIEINIPNNVTELSGYAFYGCSSLCEIEISDSVRHIGGLAFGDCTSLSTVKLGSGLTEVEGSAFSRCSNLTDVYYNGTEEQWKTIIIAADENKYLINAVIHFESSNENEIGDINGDNTINNIDAMRVLQYAVGLIGNDDIDTSVADVNGDGKINNIDAMVILQYAVGLITSFPTV